jgi:hypothetical protein
MICEGLKQRKRKKEKRERGKKIILLLDLFGVPFISITVTQGIIDLLFFYSRIIGC